jgi:hypothetical protein
MAKKKVSTIRLGDIVIDSSYQVRMQINKDRINAYHNVLKSNEPDNPFPSIIVETKTNKLVCGFTRIEAYRKYYSPDDEVPVEFKIFATEKERLIFSIADNSHGQPLGSWDKKNLFTKLKDLGATDEEISKLYGWPTDRIRRMVGGLYVVRTIAETELENEDDGVEEAIVDRGDSRGVLDAFVTVSGNSMPVKHGLGHLHGRVISSEVYDRMTTNYSGMHTHYHIKQLTMRIDDNTIDTNNTTTIELLRALSEKLDNLLVNFPPVIEDRREEAI